MSNACRVLIIAGLTAGVLAFGSSVRVELGAPGWTTNVLGALWGVACVVLWRGLGRPQ